MDVIRFAIKSCCGYSSLAMKFDRNISKDFLPLLMDGGFKAADNYSKSGILYIENDSFIAQGAFGSNILQFKCKNKEKCHKKIDQLEELLKTIGETGAEQKAEN
jgi:hypothetical protein